MSSVAIHNGLTNAAGAGAKNVQAFVMQQLMLIGGQNGVHVSAFALPLNHKSREKIAAERKKYEEFIKAIMAYRSNQLRENIETTLKDINKYVDVIDRALIKENEKPLSKRDQDKVDLLETSKDKLRSYKRNIENLDTRRQSASSLNNIEEEITRFHKLKVGISKTMRFLGRQTGNLSLAAAATAKIGFDASKNYLAPLLPRKFKSGDPVKHYDNANE